MNFATRAIRVVIDTIWRDKCAAGSYWVRKAESAGRDVAAGMPEILRGCGSSWAYRSRCLQLKRTPHANANATSQWLRFCRRLGLHPQFSRRFSGISGRPPGRRNPSGAVLRCGRFSSRFGRGRRSDCKNGEALLAAVKPKSLDVEYRLAGFAATVLRARLATLDGEGAPVYQQVAPQPLRPFVQGVLESRTLIAPSFVGGAEILPSFFPTSGRTAPNFARWILLDKRYSGARLHSPQTRPRLCRKELKRPPRGSRHS